MGRELAEKLEALRKRLNLLSEHALEFVAEINGVTWIDDSISITIERTWQSLNSVPGSVILLIGGIDSKTDYGLLEELAERKVKYFIFLGSDDSRFMKAFLKKGIEISTVSSIQEAVNTAAAMAKPGDLVLLSPACPSYHPFDNYKNRGNDFKRAVKILQDGKN